MVRWYFHGVGATLLINAMLAAPAFGHARFKLDGLLKPRTNATGLKTAPCGDAVRTTAPAILTPSQKVTVEWEETVDHPGFFRISFSPADDLGFESNILLDNIIDTQNDGVLPHFYRADVTLPNQTCTTCTLQLIQVMTENPAAPTNYYSCSDIQLGAAPPAPAPVSNLAATTGDGQITLSWQTPATTIASTLVLQSEAPISGLPIDGQSYTLGSMIGNALVQFVGVGNNVTVSGLRNGTAYYFAVFTRSPAGQYSTVQQTQIVLPQAPANIAPQVILEVQQAGVNTTRLTTTGGPVTITARINDTNPSDTQSYDWSSSDARLIDIDATSSTLTFEPGSMSAGDYNISVTVTDSGIPPLSTPASLLATFTAPANTPPISAPIDTAKPTTPVTTTQREGGGSLDLMWLLVLGWSGRAILRSKY